jgi:hypothetical protein
MEEVAVVEEGEREEEGEEVVMEVWRRRWRRWWGRRWKRWGGRRWRSTSDTTHVFAETGLHMGRVLAGEVVMHHPRHSHRQCGGGVVFHRNGGKYLGSSSE